MEDLLAPEALFVTIAVVIPGFIITRIRQKFITGRSSADDHAVLEYATNGGINFAVFSWLIYLSMAMNFSPIIQSGIWLLVVLIGPVIIGIILGISSQKDWLYRVFQTFPLRYLNVQPVHHVPTAWDWKFGRMQEQWSLIELIDGTKYGGYVGRDSFAWLF